MQPKRIPGMMPNYRADRTGSALAAKFAYAIGGDALTNVFREFWPDIATHVLHRHP